MIHQRAQRLALARLVGQAGELLFGLREQAVERLLQPALRRIERWRLALKAGVVMLQTRLVQAVDSSTPNRLALGNRFGPGMKLAAAALTTDGSESLATDTSGIVVLSQDQGRVAIAQP